MRILNGRLFVRALTPALAAEGIVVTKDRVRTIKYGSTSRIGNWSYVELHIPGDEGPDDADFELMKTVALTAVKVIEAHGFVVDSHTDKSGNRVNDFQHWLNNPEGTVGKPISGGRISIGVRERNPR